MRITKKHVVTLILLFFIFTPVFVNKIISPARADEQLVNSQTGLEDVAVVFGGDQAKQDVRYLAANMISIVLSFLSIIFLGLILFAGFQYMTAGGNQEKTTKAVSLIKNAVIGLVIVLSAWMITRFTIVMMNRAAINAPLDYPIIGM